MDMLSGQTKISSETYIIQFQSNLGFKGKEEASRQGYNHNQLLSIYAVKHRIIIRMEPKIINNGKETIVHAFTRREFQQDDNWRVSESKSVPFISD